MTFKTPHFELRRVNDDGEIESGVPEVYSVLGLPGDTCMDRRGFLGTGLAIGGVLAAAGMSVSFSQDAADQDQSVTAPPKKPCGDVALAHQDLVSSVTFSPDGKWLASGSAGNPIKLWTMPEGKLHATLKGHGSPVNSVAFSPDGKWLASGAEGKTIALWALPEGKLETCLFDPALLDSTRKAMQYTGVNVHGQTVTYTLPCASPIPAGAICTCNCVPGTSRVTRSGGAGGGGSYRYCTCVPVYCQAHRLLTGDAAVRTMAEELLLLMGLGELAYMRWAASEVGGRLRTCIEALIGALQQGATPNPTRWPDRQVLATYLDHDDQVTALMAAQLLLQRADWPRHRLPASLECRARTILLTGEARHQAVRAQVAAFASARRT